MRKILAAAALALAAALPALPASAAVTHGPGPGPGNPVAGSTYTQFIETPLYGYRYNCTPAVTGYTRQGHPEMGDLCLLTFGFNGPSGAWSARFQAPREKLTDFAWQINDSSEMGSTAPQTRYAPLTVSGYPDIYPGGILPAGAIASGWVQFYVPAGERIPLVSVQVQS